MTRQLNLFDSLAPYEGSDLEYKSARGGLPGDLWPTYSAFANTDGGVILLGVAERPDGGIDVHGVEHPHKLIKDFWNAVNNKSKVNRNLLKSADVAIIPLDAPGRSVVRIDVRRADRHERPVYVGADPLTGSYRRNYEGDYHCTEAEVRRMFADQSDESQDSRILAHFTLDDLHADSIRQFRNRWASRSPNDPWLAEDDRGLLAKLGGWRLDRSTRKEGLTVAGLLMFGKSQAIIDPAAVPGFHLDYRERFSEDPAIRWTDRVFDDGSFECNLFQFFQRVIVKLSSGPGVKQPFQVDAQGYRQTTTPVHEALQEALVNALIHGDYMGQGGVIIDRYVDRMEFSNPGTLLLSREQLSRGGVSECRNKSLQRMFQKLGVGDKLGSGIDKIRSSWKSCHWQSPILKETSRPDRVVLSLPMVSVLPDEALAGLVRQFGEARISLLSPDEVQTLATTAQEGDVSNQRMQDLLSLHRVDITSLLRKLVREGFLIADGIGRGRHYVLASATTKGGGNSPPSEVNSPPSEVNSPPSEANSRPSNPLSRLEEIAGAVRKQKRASQNDVRRVILALCSEEYLSIQQLANLLGRAPEKLREKFVSELVREGKLVLRFPDIPNHPDQAYRTVEQP